MKHEQRLLFPILQPFYGLAERAGYTLLRVGFGAILVTHGLPKVLGSGHGQMANPAASAVNFIRNGLHLPGADYFGYFVTGLETLGGAMLALGLLTRLVAPMVAVEMAAICVVMGPTWVWLDKGIEYPFLMGLLALFIAFRGGDRYSADRWIGVEL